MITKDQMNTGQKFVLERVLSAIKNKTHITVNGPAGTGKTTTTKILIEELHRSGKSGLILAAPTHAAKKVLTKLSGIQANTIHSILKISPTTYEDQAVFEQADIPDLETCEVLICDEASMYDRKLFHILINSIPDCCSIVALGDIAQIRPVNTEDNSVEEVSPFFTHSLFEQVSLTEVMRSNAPIIDVATDVRNGGWIREEITEDGGVHDLGTVKDFMTKYFEIVKTPEDLFENRLLAYTNKSVDLLNKCVRKELYGSIDPIIKGEVIVLQEPFSKTVKDINGKNKKVIIFNNGEYLKVLSINHLTFNPFIAGVPGSVIIRYAEVKVVNIDPDEDEKVEYISVLLTQHEKDKLNDYLQSATKYLRGGPRFKWKYWWEIKGKFVDFKPLPACTIHKSQGSTIDNSFIYTKCLNNADADLSQQLLYVALTRARHNVYYMG